MTAARVIITAIAFLPAISRGGTLAQADFDNGKLDGWKIRDGTWIARDGKAVADGKFSVLWSEQAGPQQEVEMAADVSYSFKDTHAAAGLVFRMKEDGTGYAACLREIEKGVHPEFGPWERPLLQLFRMESGGWKLLQESKIMGCRSDVPRRLKVVCKGPNLWVYCEDMASPVISEFDDKFDRPGMAGLFKDHQGAATFDNVRISTITSTPAPALRADWSHVRGAIYVRSNAVNAVQMWHDYWPHVDVIDREFSYAAAYGFNMIQAYLHWIVWEKHEQEYLKRIEDFMTRASKHGLKVNLIFWDDCGHVEPGLNFANPVPGQHNSQMMPNPSHRIRNSAAEMTARRDSFQFYVTEIARKFKDDPRLSFWQIYNEGMGPKEMYRVGEADASMIRLLTWTRDWIKGTGTKIPVTATGGGFYGPAWSDFYTFHSYANPGGSLPGADGGLEHLCTETLNRPSADLTKCLAEFAQKQTGFVVWELMIGRDNCRYPWGNPDGLAEPATPFHGVIYPDGHPWDLREVKALLGEKAFAALEANSFRVEYFDGEFKTSRKVSITPRIDFDLGDEPGTGSPDASAGIGKDDFSIRWTGNLTAPATGTYELTGSSDGVFKVMVGDKTVAALPAAGSATATGKIELAAGKSVPINVEYFHKSGPARASLNWTGSGMVAQPLLLNSGKQPMGTKQP